MGMVVVADVVLVLRGVDVRGANLPGAELEKPTRRGPERAWLDCVQRTRASRWHGPDAARCLTVCCYDRCRR